MYVCILIDIRMEPKANPRNKPLRPKQLTNPLQIFLGALMRAERLRQKRTVPEVAGQLSLSSTFVKGLEQGTVALNIAMADRFIHAMAAPSDEATTNQRDIHFHRLTRYLAGSHWLAAQLAESESWLLDPSAKKDDILSGSLRAMESLKEHDRDFERLYEVVAQYLSATTDTARQELVDGDAVPEVSKFLRPPEVKASRLDAKAGSPEEHFLKKVKPVIEYTKSPGDNRKLIVEALHDYAIAIAESKDTGTKPVNLLGLLGEIPSLNYDMLRAFIDGARNRPLLHIGRYAEEWEKANKGRFVTGVCLYSSSVGIIAPLNLERFQFPYLAQEQFRELRFLFAEDHIGQGASNLRDEFFKRVALHSDIPFTEEHKAKLKIKVIPDGELTPLMNDLWSGIVVPSEITAPEKEKLHKGYWSFEVEDEVQIGFTSRKNMAHHEVMNLSFDEAMNRRAWFDELWDHVK